MSRWELLIACIKSDQVSLSQLEEHLKDPHFAAYYRQRIEKRKINASRPA